MKTTIYHIMSLVFLAGSLSAQNYNDYVGAGHNVGFTITASSSELDAGPEKTMDASGLDSPFFAAGRFLNQATMGASKEDIEELLNDFDGDYEAWIDNQLLIEPTYLSAKVDSIWDFIFSTRVNNGQDPEDIFGPYSVHFNYGWWETYMLSNDRLRQKVAYALSQILVTSMNSDLGDWAEAQTYYYDLMNEHAFGNYQDLLTDVTYSLPMGYYLSHFNNPKAVPEENIHPDENYAREIMQLFTIGLYELNVDGTRQLDANGDFIPTYGQDEIKEFAEVFTGLGPGALEPYVDWATEPYFGLGIWGTQKDTTMKMYQAFHDESEKVLLNGYVIPAGQSGDNDIADAIQHLMDHDNVGPFISHQLIQRLVKSNPTPAYIGRVAAVFNDNGSGVKGDLGAVVKAILLDEEARSGEWILDEYSGNLREPFLRSTGPAKAIGLTNIDDRYWHNGWGERFDYGQSVLTAPTVFNFYPPSFSPTGEIKDLGFVAPEFKLHNTARSVTLLNSVFGRTFWQYHGGTWEVQSMYDPYAPFTEEQSVIMTTPEWLFDYADDPEILINEIDKVMTYGQLTNETRGYMKSAIEAIDWPWDIEGQKEYRTKMALFILQFSPDYAITK